MLKSLRVSLFAIALALIALVPTPDPVFGSDYVVAFDEGPPGWEFSDLSVATVENTSINVDGFWRSGATSSSNAQAIFDAVEMLEVISIQPPSTCAVPEFTFDDEHRFSYNAEPDFVKRE